MPLNGTIGGEPIHFHDDYLFKNVPLPNSATKTGTEKTLNNTLGGLRIRGILNESLTIPAGKSLTIDLQYLDDKTWKKDDTLCSFGPGDVAAGTVLFDRIPIPDTEKRVYRLSVTTNFDASAATITCPIELMPR
jgi:hypothetical protein